MSSRLRAADPTCFMVLRKVYLSKCYSELDLTHTPKAKRHWHEYSDLHALHRQITYTHAMCTHGSRVHAMHALQSESSKCRTHS